MFVDHYSPFAPWCHSVIVDNGYLSTVGNDVYECSISKNPILSKRYNESAIDSFDVCILDSVSFCNKSVTWSDVVVSMDNNGCIEYGRISSDSGTAKGSVGICES